MNGHALRLATALLVILGSATTVLVRAQTVAESQPLPNAPGLAAESLAAPVQPGSPANTAQVTGVVLDVQGNPVPNAKVDLVQPGRATEHAIEAASDGTFTFSGLPAGNYRLIIDAPGLAAYTSLEFIVRPGETVQAPKIALNIATSTSISVTATDEQVAQAQIQEQEKQRVFGVFQNFYTSYIWNAAPMTSKQKYKLAFRTVGDPTSFLIIAGVAGAEQYKGTYPGYGSGIEGYGKRYAAAFADSLTSRVIGGAVLPSLLHQDPRYFYQGSGGVRSRAWHAISSAIVTRGDSGKLQPNYSRVLGSLAAAGIANAYHPASSRGVGLTFETFGITIGSNAIGNLVREFVLRSLEPSVPSFAKGK